MKKEYLHQIADIREYQKEIILYAFNNYQDFYDVRMKIDTFDMVINKVDLDMAISHLKPKEQFAVRHYYIYKYTQKEIANELGISEAWVSETLKVCLEKIIDYCLF